VGLVSAAANGIIIAQDKGYFQEQGLAVELTQVQAAQQTVPLLGAGQLDVGGGGNSAGLINAVASDIPIRIVADMGSTYPGFPWQGYVVRKDLKDSGVFRGCPSFKGMHVANVADGNTAHIILERMLRECGLGLSDIELVLMPFPDMMTAFANRAIDASFMLEPGLTRGQADGLFALYKSSDEIYQNQQGAVVLYGPHFIASQREAGKRFMVAYLKAVRDYWDAFRRGVNKTQMIEILTRTTMVKDPVLLERIAPTGLNPDGYINLQTFAQDIDWWVEHGYVKTRLDPAQVVDHSFVDYAIERLGHYALP
jgi:NitT/TauT family transport system substrate-binding protein